MKSKGPKPKCWCGCGRNVTRRFKPGHDSKFHSKVKRVVLGELKFDDAVKRLPPPAVTAFREEMQEYEVVEV